MRRLLVATLATLAFTGGIVWWTHDRSHQIDPEAPTPQVDVYQRITGHTDCDALALELEVATVTGQGVYRRLAAERMDELGCPVG